MYLIICFGILGLFIIFSSYNDKYQIEYQNHIISNFIKTAYGSLVYEIGPNDKLKQHYEYASGKFLDELNFYFETDNYLTGEVEGIKIEACDTLLKSKRSRGIRQYNGLFVYSNINKKLSNEIRIRNNKNKGILQNYKIELENNKKKDYFEVFTKSSSLARKILNANIINEIINFCENSNFDFEIIIIENKLYMKYDVGAVFRSNFFCKIIDKNRLLNFYNVLNFSIRLSSLINNSLENYHNE